MAEFHFFTTWDIEAPIDAVWGVLGDATRYPTWWKYVQDVSEIEPNNADGIGGLYLYTWKTALPYSLAFEMRVTGNTPPHLLEAHADGELAGVGRWELKDMGSFTRVTYDWKISSKITWMNLFAPVARPAFTWNHGVVMDEGGRALTALLGVKLLSATNITLN